MHLKSSVNLVGGGVFLLNILLDYTTFGNNDGPYDKRRIIIIHSKTQFNIEKLKFYTIK